MWSRRDFINKTTGAGVGLFIPGWLNATGLTGEELTRLIILHTNDVHSRVEPFPNDGSKNAGLGGAARRATLIERIR